MLVEIAIGDAYGAAFEYAPPGPGRPNDLGRYYRHPRHGIAPGCYTDDTQMSIAVAETLLEHGPEATPLQFTAKFVEAFQRDPREGYAGRFWDFLKSIRDAEDFAARIVPHSAKSGAAMRSCPIGVLPRIDDLLAVAERQAQITHDTAGGIHSSQAVAMMTHYFLYRRGPRADLPSFLLAHVAGEWSPHRGKVGPEGVVAARAAVTALVAENSLSGLLRRCIDFGGDVDTVAAIALGAASGSPDYAQDLPQVLYDTLEDGPYGLRWLRELDARLLALAAR